MRNDTIKKKSHLFHPCLGHAYHYASSTRATLHVIVTQLSVALTLIRSERGGEIYVFSYVEIKTDYLICLNIF